MPFIVQKKKKQFIFEYIFVKQAAFVAYFDESD